MNIKDKLLSLCILFFGLFILVVGVYFATQHPLISTILVGTGGALIGTAVSTYIGKLSVVELEGKIHQIISESFKIGLSLDDERVAPFRKKWYTYHVTKLKINQDDDKDPEYVWRHSIFDFGIKEAVGKLIGQLESEGHNGIKHPYKIEGFIKQQGGRLVVCVTRTDSTQEPSGIYIYPYFQEQFRNFHCGVGIIKTWSNVDAITPCIISNTPILKGRETLGTLEKEHNSTLTYLWKKNVDHIILPMIIDKPEELHKS